MKAKALAALKQLDRRPQAGEGEQPGWRFPEAWTLSWKQNQDLQREILSLGGTLIRKTIKLWSTFRKALRIRLGPNKLKSQRIGALWPATKR